MTYLGKFATPEQIDALKHAANFPVMYLSGGERMGGDPQKMAHQYALDAGLPEFEGYYGCDLRTGEFVKP